MSIAVKVINGKKYAYLAYRIKEKIVQKYLGPVSNPKVAEKMNAIKSEKEIPAEYRHLFWDTDPAKIDIKSNQRYIIERVLEFGRIDALRWLQLTYPTKSIIETLLTTRKISVRSKNFWGVWFGVKHAY